MNKGPQEDKLIALLSVGLPDKVRENFADRLIDAKILDGHLKIVLSLLGVIAMITSAIIGILKIIHR